MLRLGIALITLVLLTSPVGAQQEQRYALVVGASSYTNGLRVLRGPRNDVTLVVNTLLDQGVPRDNIRVLGDGLQVADYERKVAADGEPRLAEILAGLDWLATRAGSRSHVLVYFSGHGTQVPTRDWTNEPDGYDEVFLPLDVGPAPEPGAPIVNALNDNLLEPRLNAILARGASVWFVADSCHSGSLSRAGETERVARFVRPESLGVSGGMPSESGAIIPPNDVARAHGGALGLASADRFVGFFAAQPEQVAFESPAPVTAPALRRRVHGEFTWNLVRALQAGGFANYAGLAQQTLATQFQNGRSNVVPMFEGALARSPMLGAGATHLVSVAQRGNELFLRGGAIDEIEEGAVFELVDLARESHILARARVAEVGLNDARLEILDASGDSEGLLQRARASGSSVELARLAARLIERRTRFVVRVAAPALLPGAAAAGADTALLSRTVVALGELIALPPQRQPVALELAASGEAADIYPVVAENRLWLFHRGDVVDIRGAYRPYSMAASEVTRDGLGAALRIKARTVNLLRVVAASSDAPLSRALAAQVFVRPGVSRPATVSCPQHRAEEVDDIPGAAAEAPIRAGRIQIQHCDEVFVRIENRSPRTIDVTPLYIDPWGQIYFLPTYRGAQYGGMRLNPGQARMISYTEDLAPTAVAPWRPLGAMQLVLLSVEADVQAPYPADFRYLAQELESNRTGAAAGTGFTALLDQAGFGDGGVRSGASRRADTGGGAVVVPVVTALGN